MLIFGYYSELALLISLIFFLVSITLIYIVVNLLTGDSKKGLYTALVFSSLPQIYEQSRVFHLDLPLIALLLSALYCFIKSKSFTNTKYVILFAIFFSLAQLTKWYGFLYLIAPILMGVMNSGYQFKKQLKKFFINMLIFLLIVCVIAMPWYIFNYEKIIEYSRIFAEGEIDDPTDLLSLTTLMYYPQRILSHQIFLLPSILTLAGLINLFFKSRTRFIIVFASILIPMFLFTVIGNKNLRYVMPLTPLFAYLIVDFVYGQIGKVKQESQKAFQKILSIVLLTYLAFTFFFTSFNQATPQSNYLKYIGMVFSGQYYDVWYYEPQLYAYSAKYYPVKEIWDYIKEDSGNFQEGFGVTPLLDKKDFSLATFELLRREQKFTKAFVPVPYFQFEPFASNQEILDYFDNNGVRYVLVTENPGPEGLRNFKVLQQMNMYMMSRKNTHFELIKSFDLPDNTQIHIYKRLPKGQEITYQVNMTCKTDAGAGDGIESIQLTPNHTYVFYTGHFAILDLMKGDYKPDNIYTVQIENIPHRSILDVYNLPTGGTGMCEYDDLEIDLSQAIQRPIQEPNHCGIDCQTATYYKWNVGDQTFHTEVYSRGQTSEPDNSLPLGFE